MAVGAVARGDLVMVFDPSRGDGSGTGFRGLAMVEEVGADEVRVRPIDQLHNYVRLRLSAIHIVFSATYVAEDLLT